MYTHNLHGTKTKFTLVANDTSGLLELKYFKYRIKIITNRKIMVNTLLNIF